MARRKLGVPGRDLREDDPHGKYAVKMLLATDGSDPALRAGSLVAGLAAPGRDEVRILTVLSYHEYPYSLVPGEHMVGEQQAAERARKHVDQVTADSRRRLESAGVSVTVGSRFGNPRDEILAEISEWEPDLIVLGRRGVRGIERLLGSVSEHVLHHATVPVLFVP